MIYMKIMISMPQDMHEEIKKKSSDMTLSTSAYIRLAIKKAIEND